MEKLGKGRRREGMERLRWKKRKRMRERMRKLEGGERKVSKIEN